MKFLSATLLAACLVLPAHAQAPAKPANGKATPAANGNKAKPARAGARSPATSEAARKAREARERRRAAIKALTPGQKQAIEVLTPVEEPDPAIRLDERELAVAKLVHVGEIPCELGAKVEIRPLRREGFFLVRHGATRFVMHPVRSRTGAVRLEDPGRGAVWLQLGNKSMLMNQKLGRRLADECQSPAQLAYAEEMKTRPPVNLLEPEAKPAAGAASAPAVAAQGPAASSPVPAATVAEPAQPVPAPVPAAEPPAAPAAPHNDNPAMPAVAPQATPASAPTQ